MGEWEHVCITFSPDNDSTASVAENVSEILATDLSDLPVSFDDDMAGLMNDLQGDRDEGIEAAAKEPLIESRARTFDSVNLSLSDFDVRSADGHVYCGATASDGSSAFKEFAEALLESAPADGSILFLYTRDHTGAEGVLHRWTGDGYEQVEQYEHWEVGGGAVVAEHFEDGYDIRVGEYDHEFVVPPWE